MSWVTRGTVAMAVSAGGAAVGRVLTGRGRGNWPQRGGGPYGGTRWQVVTVNRSRTELLPQGRLPEPLARLGAAVEVRLREAPGNRGTELAARPREADPDRLPGMAAHLTGDDPALAVRAALREAKQLAETGEVLRPDAPPTTHPTPLNRLLGVSGEQGGDA